MTTIYLGLGSSIGNKEEIINGALLEIKKWGRNFRVSSFVYSEPWGGVAKNSFLNAVCSFEILENKDNFNNNLSPEKLLEKIHILENKFQRIRSVKWEDRTLDVDILLYGKESIQTENLTIPHIYILERNFVYEPLLEIMNNNTKKNKKIKKISDLKILISNITTFDIAK